MRPQWSPLEGDKATLEFQARLCVRELIFYFHHDICVSWNLVLVWCDAHLSLVIAIVVRSLFSSPDSHRVQWDPGRQYVHAILLLSPVLTEEVHLDRRILDVFPHSLVGRSFACPIIWNKNWIVYWSVFPSYRITFKNPPTPKVPPTMLDPMTALGLAGNIV